MNYSRFMSSRRPSLTQLRAVRRFLNNRHNTISNTADLLLHHNLVNSREEALWQAEIEWDYEMSSRITGERN